MRLPSTISKADADELIGKFKRWLKDTDYTLVVPMGVTIERLPGEGPSTVKTDQAVSAADGGQRRPVGDSNLIADVKAKRAAWILADWTQADVYL